MCREFLSLISATTALLERLQRVLNAKKLDEGALGLQPAPP
jgi:hypothetical protein